MPEEFKRITVKDIAELDIERYTVVDLREPDEVIAGSIEGSINIQFSAFYPELGDKVGKAWSKGKVFMK